MSKMKSKKFSKENEEKNLGYYKGKPVPEPDTALIAEQIGEKYLVDGSKNRSHGGDTVYDPENFPRIAFNCIASGLGMKEVAAMVGTSRPSTLSAWRNKYPEFDQAFKSGADFATQNVVRSMYKCATGFSVPEEKVFCTKEGEIVTHVTEKYYKPDVVAGIFWTKNRDPENWKDKRDVEVKGGIKLVPADKNDEDL